MKALRITLIGALCAFVAVGFLSCSDGDDSDGDYIKIADNANTTKIYSNPANDFDGAFKFTTSGAWTSQLSGDNPEDWLTVTPSSGSTAGTYELGVHMAANRSTNDRNAELKITCGTASRTFYIVQRGGYDDGTGDIPTDKFANREVTITLDKDHLSQQYSFYAFGTVYISCYTLNCIDPKQLDFYREEETIGTVLRTQFHTYWTLYSQGEESVVGTTIQFTQEGVVDACYTFTSTQELSDREQIIIEISYYGIAKKETY